MVGAVVIDRHRQPWRRDDALERSLTVRSLPMILRFSQKPSSRLKTGTLQPLASDGAPVADWTSHVFFFDRTPYILTSNTATLYSTVLYAKGITNDSVFIVRLLSALREFMDADGLAFAYERFTSPRTGVIRLASTFSRSVTGSMNELVGEKFINFLSAAETEESFRVELPAFASEVRDIFEY